MWRRLGLIGIVVLIVVFGWYRLSLQPVSNDTAKVAIAIEKGMSVHAISRLLEKEGIIRSALAFRLYTRFQAKQASLQAGQFYLQPSMSAAEVLEVLHKGLAEEVAVTVPEGYTLRDIDSLLASKKLITAGKLIECAQTCDFSRFGFLPSASNLADRGGQLEGYLYPDTYFVAAGNFEPKEFLERMLQTFEKRVVQKYRTQITESSRSLHQIVTMASLVEEESRHDEERAFVAGILWKRLDNTVLLGVDAAVRYIVNKPGEALTKTDLQVDSPYNLRTKHGLPPGPIASPSLSSIEATLAPQPSQYWYYLHDSAGRIHYAVTNDEHNENKAKYL